MNKNNNIRIENDSMGSMSIDSNALYGASTKRAVDNFPVSWKMMPESFIKSMALLKLCCARANKTLKLIDDDLADAIIDVAREIYNGNYMEHFVVDIYQTGSGTSTNMNLNEVISNLANLKLGSSVGDKKPVHPNDHVNKGQSSNDTIPTAIHISVYIEIVNKLIPTLQELQSSFESKKVEFDKIVKSGRTHLQDAVPITLGQEFSSYARQIESCINRIKSSFIRLSELAIGGTAVGTGINTHKDFSSYVCKFLSEETGINFKEALNHFEAQASKDTCVEVSGDLKTLATALMKIANDIRFLGSGPRAGIGEIILPEVQPGSSIMPGKVNPVIAESVTQVAAKVIGNDLAVTIAGQSGNFQLNVMMPLIADSILESISLLTNVCKIFDFKCIRGIKADLDVCKKNVENNLIISTSLVPELGYDTVALLTKEAYKRNLGIKDIVLEKKLLDEEKLNRILNPISMT